jgi:hypothetical protein
MPFQKPVAAAVEAVRQLGKSLDADLDLERGGCAWWHEYGLEHDVLIGITDYLWGLLLAVENNLQTAAIHLAELKQLRYTDDLWIMRVARQPEANFRRSGIDALRRSKIDAHVVGVLRSVGSVLDTLAGVVIAVGGFKADLVMADSRSLLPLDAGPDYPGTKGRKAFGLSAQALEPADPQGSLLRATRSSFLAAGPTGWVEWATWSRNDVVHRADRNDVLVLIDERTLARPLPRQPKHLEAHAYRTSESLDEMVLTEDSLTTLSGVVGSINAAVTGTMTACTELWRRRRADPALIEQPATQWKTGGSPSNAVFEGYEPGSAVAPTGAFVSTSPTVSRRWQAAQVLDHHRPEK